MSGAGAGVGAVLRKILTTGLLAGFAAAIVLSLVQFIAVDPLIAEAEVLETRAAAGGAPQDDFARTGFTVLANLIAGTGFGFLLAGCFALYGGRVDAKRGLLWGLAGYAVFALAPALGLPPEAPGAAAADLLHRQTWWIGTVMATAAGLALLVFSRPWFLRAGGVAMLALPHLIGAPHQPAGSGIPPELATAFIAASLTASGLFWLALGGISGTVYRRLAGP